MRAASSAQPASARHARAAPPAASMAVAVARAAGASTSPTSTRAPARASASAPARPSPEPPPVTIATLPARSDTLPPRAPASSRVRYRAPAARAAAGARRASERADGRTFATDVCSAGPRAPASGEQEEPAMRNARPARGIARVAAAAVRGRTLAVPAAAEEVTVTVGHNRIDPASVTIRAGDTVVFHNVDEMPGGHTIAAQDGSFQSPPLAKDQKW